MQIKIGFIFNYCTDILVTRDFYSNVLGLEEIQFNNDKESPWKWVVYKSGDLQLMFFQTPDKLEEFHILPPGFSNLPGDGIGDNLATAFSMTGYDLKTFKETINLALKKKCETQASVPSWRQDSYWGFTLNDPMGRTVEIVWEPKEDELELKVPWSKKG